MERKRDVRRGIVKLGCLGCIILSAFVLLAWQADWTIYEIMRSLVGPGLLLTLALIRGTTRREVSDHLWIVAAGTLLVNIVVHIIGWLRRRDAHIKDKANNAPASDPRSPPEPGGPNLEVRDGEGNVLRGGVWQREPPRMEAD